MLRKFEKRGIMEGGPYQSLLGKFADTPQRKGGPGAGRFQRAGAGASVRFHSILHGVSDGQGNSGPGTILAAVPDAQ